jgi:methyl-accepting chemotaxis protein
VNKAVTEMDKVVQSTAAQTEALSSTGQSMAEQSDHLQALVAQFKLDGQSALKSSRVIAPVAPVSKAQRMQKNSDSAAMRKANRQASPATGEGRYDPQGFEEF